MARRAASPGTDAPESPLGRSVPRREDPALLTGRAHYTDDLQPEDALHMAVLRSPHANARLTGVDAAGARALDGVVAVHTGEAVAASDHAGPIPPSSSLPSPQSAETSVALRKPLTVPDWPMLATDRVRHVGQPVAVVVASDRYTAAEARDRIEADYERIDPIVTIEDALDGPAVHEDVPDNLGFDWAIGDEAATDAAFDDADHVVDLELDRQRLIPNPIEPRAAVSSYDEGALTIRRTTQSPHSSRSSTAEILGLPPDRVRADVPAVGGSFGSKNRPYPAELMTAWCAIRHGRPVRWQATRSEAHVSDTHGRGHAVQAALAFDDDGRLRGLRAESHVDLGAFLVGPAASIHTTSFTRTLTGQYRIPAMHARVVGVFTTTTPVSAYRSTSEPIAALVFGGLLDRAARRLGVDPVALRRRNLVPPEAFPYETPLGARYDSGEYERALDLALSLADYDAVRERQSRRRSGARDGDRLLGVGVSCTVDGAGDDRPETARVRLEPAGRLTAYTGSFDHGQGHHTTHAQVLADRLGVAQEDVEVHDGDTDDLPGGTGTYGSRTVGAAGAALRACADELVERARPVAARRLEAAEADVEFTDGAFHVAGARDRAVSLATVARLAAEEDVDLDVTEAAAGAPQFPFGTHVAVVEVDPGTGEVDLDRYVAVDDCGTQINPEIVEGQVLGGIAQGLGQARYEGAVYDDAGNLLTGSLLDYAMPRAGHLPDVEVGSTVTPSPYTANGVKGCAEGGTVAAPAAIVSAVADALAPIDVDLPSPPLTDEAIWRAVNEAS